MRAMARSFHDPTRRASRAAVTCRLAMPSPIGGVRRSVARGAVARAAALLDLLAGHADDVPLGAEGLDALALRAAGLAAVEHERVQRVAAVGDLRAAVGALGRAQLGLARAAAR